jgi:hypothetical protein
MELTPTCILDVTSIVNLMIVMTLGVVVIVSSDNLIMLYIILINWTGWKESNYFRISVLVCMVASYGHWRIELLKSFMFLGGSH